MPNLGVMDVAVWCPQVLYHLRRQLYWFLDVIQPRVVPVEVNHPHFHVVANCKSTMTNSDNFCARKDLPVVRDTELDHELLLDLVELGDGDDVHHHPDLVHLVCGRKFVRVSISHRSTIIFSTLVFSPYKCDTYSMYEKGIFSMGQSTIFSNKGTEYCSKIDVMQILLQTSLHAKNQGSIAIASLEMRFMARFTTELSVERSGLSDFTVP